MLFLQDATEELPEEQPEELPEEQPEELPEELPEEPPTKTKKRKTTPERLTEEKVAKKLEESIINEEEETTTIQENDIENEEIDAKEKCKRKYELFEKAIGKHQQKIIFLTSKQGEVLVQLKDIYVKEDRMIDYLVLIDSFGLKKSTANLKIRIAELVKEFPKLQKTNLSLYFINKYFKEIRRICQKSGQQYK